MVKHILRAVRSGDLSIAEAARLLDQGYLPGGKHAKFDLPRASRTGLPEVLLGEGKSLEHFEELLVELRRSGAGVIISRLTRPQLRSLQRHRLGGWDLEVHVGPRLALLHRDSIERSLAGRRAALISAGTADAHVAEEVRLVLEALGAEVVTSHDVGVAGIHRLLRELPRLAAARPSVYIVCAGREGALATVVAGLVDRPVIGVPTSQGYGRGGAGEGALTSMLQSCAPLAVVNIDGGVPAALVATQILRLAGRASGAPHRRKRPPRSATSR